MENLQLIRKINLDFYSRKNIVIEAKRFDKSSRYILITCYNQGDLFIVNENEHASFIRYRKSDEFSVFNSCVITEEGKILVELTEQMLSVPGNCIADVLIVSKESIVFENGLPTITNNGELQISPSNIISSMKFGVNVIDTPFENSEIESSYEFNALNDLMNKITADYSEIISRSDGNLEEVLAAAQNAKLSEENAKASENIAIEKAGDASASAEEAGISAQASSDSATASAQARDDSIAASEESERNANIATEKASEASTSADMAKESEENAKDSEDNAENYADESKDWSIESKSWAQGNTGVREDEDTNNSKYWCEQSKNNKEMSESYLAQIEQAGDNAVNAINNALDIAVPNFVVDLDTMCLMYEGGRFNFQVNEGYLEWGMMV